MERDIAKPDRYEVEQKQEMGVWGGGGWWAWKVLEEICFDNISLKYQTAAHTIGE